MAGEGKREPLGRRPEEARCGKGPCRRARKGFPARGAAVWVAKSPESRRRLRCNGGGGGGRGCAPPQPQGPPPLAAGLPLKRRKRRGRGYPPEKARDLGRIFAPDPLPPEKLSLALFYLLKPLRYRVSERRPCHQNRHIAEALLNAPPGQFHPWSHNARNDACLRHTASTWAIASSTTGCWVFVPPPPGTGTESKAPINTASTPGTGRFPRCCPPLAGIRT